MSSVNAVSLHGDPTPRRAAGWPSRSARAPCSSTASFCTQRCWRAVVPWGSTHLAPLSLAIGRLPTHTRALPLETTPMICLLLFCFSIKDRIAWPWHSLRMRLLLRSCTLPGCRDDPRDQATTGGGTSTAWRPLDATDWDSAPPAAM